MKRSMIAAAALAALAGPAFAGARDFTLVNGTSVPLGQVEIRRFGTESWKPLASSPSPGARASVAFADEDCAFDMRATVAGKPVTWTGINLCEAKSVTLKRNASGEAWVDYD